MLRRNLIGDRRGSAAVEFAFIVPIVLALYFGMVEATQALLANRRAGALTTAVGDLVTQQAQVTTAEVNNIFNASTAIMKPFPTDGLAMRVTSIEINASGTPVSKWTVPRGSIPVTNVGTVATAMRTPNTAVLRAEVLYTYRTPFQKMLPGAFTFRHKMDLSPRAGVPIALN
ncbi:TadE/TadG family type IV pilus assembly protein [Phenylobacterium sp.]|uniref:TadE/TadG family type IV pilus assembly protein n=1 Tax=Phenylobacterium sp. TaxID=1871053 RepID=UPI00289F32AD|nr:TadE/TadG family type IV pilus assembly protein [Phenylobacterium sp.]